MRLFLTGHSDNILQHSGIFSAISFFPCLLLISLAVSGCLAREDSSWTPAKDYLEYDEDILAYHRGKSKDGLKLNKDPKLESRLAGELGLEMIVSAVQNRNPSLRAMKNAYFASRRRILPAQSLEDPKLVARSERNRDMKTIDYAFGFRQEFPWPGKLGLRGQMAGQEAEIMNQKYVAMLNEVTAKTKASFQDYRLVFREIDIMKENLELLKSMEKVAETRYKASKVTQQDVLKAQMEISTLENALIDLERDREIIKAQINNLLSREPNAPLGNPEPGELSSIQSDLDALYTRALGNNPDLKTKLYAIDMAKTKKDMARKEYYPDFMTGIDYSRMEMREGNMGFGTNEQEAIMFMLEFNLSFFNLKRKDAELDAAEKETKAAQDAYRAQANDTLFQVKRAYEKIKSAERLATLFKDTLIPQAEQALKVSQKQYEAGAVGFLDLLDTQRKLLEFRLQWEKSLADAGRERAMLEVAIGEELK